MASVATPAYATWNVQLDRSTLENFCAVVAEVDWENPVSRQSALSSHSPNSGSYWRKHFLLAVRDRMWDTLYSGKKPEGVGEDLMKRYRDAEPFVNRHLGLPELRI